jgi:2-polyprenyl-6-methoxyphenol hydroxylase-like FAD-dependent oxidoreductase
METVDDHKKTSVVIVGAGPTGLSMAAQLLRYGIDFIILDKKETTTLLSKAIVVQARSLEIFQELGLAEKALSEGQITTALNLFYKGKQKAAVNLAGLGNGLSPYPFALSLEQCKTEKLLADHLSVHGKNVLWKSGFSRLQQTDEGVTVYYKDSSGLERKIEAEYVVGCDGAGSKIRRELDFSFEGDTVPKIFYVADVRLKSSVINKNELYIFMIKKGFVLFFPMEGEGHYRVVGMLPEVTEVDEGFKFEDIQSLVEQQVAVPLMFKQVLWFSSYKVHSRKANSFQNNRCFIAGDAAHIHTPAGGQGMNTGIQDAYNLAWKIAGVIKNELNPSVLKTYDLERGENAKHLLQTTDRMFDIMSGANRFWNWVRLNIFTRILDWATNSAMIKRNIFPLISQTGIRYSANMTIVKSSVGKVKAGVRMPYFEIPTGKQIFDYLSEPCFKVLFFGDEEKNVFAELNRSAIRFSTYNFKDIPKSLFGSERNFYVLLRPDNHISYIGNEIEKCRDLLISFSSQRT